MDEKSDAADTMQLGVFVLGINIEFSIPNDLAALMPFRDTATSVDLYKQV
jgi:hypothetical protein